MDNTIIFSLPENLALADHLANKLNIKKGCVVTHSFPDGETYIRIDSDVQQQTVILVASLDHPDNKVLPLLFMAQSLKELGAKKICLVSPYLPYMRQDKRFKSGEALTANIFAKFLSSAVDCLITIDPHLHRIKNLADIYSIPAYTLHATQPIAEWVMKNIQSPIIIGPDEESSQWVADVANIIHAPYAIIKKIRYGDRKISITLPDLDATDKTPVLIDDIISTATSMIAVTEQLIARQFQKPICIGVHALFNLEAEKKLLQAGAQCIISCNTIPHSSNGIDITDVVIARLHSV